MNEFFATEPNAFSNSNEFKLLLGYFGPYSGRYIEEYPGKDAWSNSVNAHFANAGVMEQERIKTLLRRAREDSKILSLRKINWNPSETWLQNALHQFNMKPPLFSGIVSNSGDDSYSLHNFDITPVADEKILGTPEEYLRVSKTLLLISHELYFIDPYLKLPIKKVRDVIHALLSELYKGKCNRAVFITRASEVFGDACRSTITSDIKRELVNISKTAGLKRGTNLEFRFVQDETSISKIHGRYLLSLKGAVRLDQGFQALPTGRKVDVGPVGKSVHNDLLSVFVEGENDFKIVEQFSFVV